MGPGAAQRSGGRGLVPRRSGGQRAALFDRVGCPGHAGVVAAQRVDGCGVQCRADRSRRLAGPRRPPAAGRSVPTIRATTAGARGGHGAAPPHRRTGDRRATSFDRAGHPGHAGVGVAQRTDGRGRCRVGWSRRPAGRRWAPVVGCSVPVGRATTAGARGGGGADPARRRTGDRRAPERGRGVRGGGRGRPCIRRCRRAGASAPRVGRLSLICRATLLGRIRSICCAARRPVPERGRGGRSGGRRRPRLRRCRRAGTPAPRIDRPTRICRLAGLTRS